MASVKAGNEKELAVTTSGDVPPGSENKSTGGQSTGVRTDVVLPQKKVKAIMKSSPEIDALGMESVFLITKATELFVEHLTTAAHSSAKGDNNLQYKNIAEVVHTQENMGFLRDIVPVNMSARAALAEIAKQEALDNEEMME